MPAVTPFTVPVEVTVAIPVVLLLQVPLLVVEVSMVEAPAQTAPAPVIAAGDGITVIAFVTMQPVPSEYVIVTVPAVTPVTSPLVLFTVARAALLLLHNPPVGLVASIVMACVQTVPAPVIAVGAVLTFTVVVTEQVEGNVYVITVLPIVSPFTTPVDEPIVATPILLLLHVPPLGPVANVVELPAHTVVAPEIGAGNGLTLIVALPLILFAQPVVVFVAVTV